MAMLKRFVQMSDKLSGILLQLDHAPDMITFTELNILKEFIQLLEPCTVTNIVLRDKYFTSSTTIPGIKMIKHKLKSIIIMTDFSSRLKKLLIDEFQKRFEKIQTTNLLYTATLLDPRFKKIHFENHAAYANVVKKVFQYQAPEPVADQPSQVSDCPSKRTAAKMNNLKKY